MIRTFGTTQDGREVQAITLAAGELRLTLLTLGSITQDIRLEGVPYGLTLGGPDLAAYDEGPMKVWGAICGPVANRIRGAKAEIDGQMHAFQPAPGKDILLHSGVAAIHRKVWSLDARTESAATLSVDLPDGEGGFPGNRRITARWELGAAGTIDLTLEAETDAATLINLAHHPYWNLDGSEHWAGHVFEARASAYLDAEDGMPTGAVVPVDGTRFDFRAARPIPRDAGPIDHNLCLGSSRRALTPAASLTGRSGLRLDIATTEPGLQVYDGERLHEVEGHDGRRFGPYSGFALEPQFWPDAPNHDAFPSILLRPGEAWRQHTRYSFARG